MRLVREGRVCGIRFLGAFCTLMLTISRPSANLAEAARNAEFCPSAGTDRAAVANIDERLEITLKDGRTLRLAGLEPPRPTPDAPDFDTAARDALAQRVGGQVAFVPLARMSDRWGRIPAFVFFDSSVPDAAPVSAADLLLAGGFARFMPEPEARPCRGAFLAAEAKARAAKLGLWRDPFYAILAATDRQAFAERAATNVIVEGRLVAIDEGPLRTNLQFAPRWERRLLGHDPETQRQDI